MMRVFRLVVVWLLLSGLTQLYAQGNILGQVVDAVSGQPVSGVALSSGGYTKKVDAQGRFSFEGLPPGDFNLYTKSPRFLNQVVSVRVGDDLDTELTIKLQTRVTKLEGYIYDDEGRPVIGVEIYTYPEIDETKTDEKGHFSFDKKRILDESRRPVGEEAIPTGEYTVFAQKLQYTKAEAKVNIISGLRNMVNKMTINKIGVPTTTEGEGKGLNTPNTVDDPTQGAGEVRLD